MVLIIILPPLKVLAQSEIFISVFFFFHVRHPFISKCLLGSKNSKNLTRYNFFYIYMMDEGFRGSVYNMIDNVRLSLFFTVRKF